MKTFVKKIVALVLSISMLISALCVGVYAYEVPKDLKGHWAEREIYTLITKNIITGYPDGTFKPDNSISRAELCKIVIEALVKYNIVSYSANSNTFSDVPKSEWFNKYVETAYKNNIVSGVGGGKFEPNNPVTREQMAKIFANVYCLVYKKSLSSISKPEITSKTFSDYKKISSWALPYVSAVYNTGLMKGSEGNFYPVKTSTRAEAGITLFRLFDFPYVGLLKVEDFVSRFNSYLSEINYNDKIVGKQWNKYLKFYEFTNQNGSSRFSSSGSNVFLENAFEFSLLVQTVTLNNHEYVDQINIFYIPKKNCKEIYENYRILYNMFTSSVIPNMTKNKLDKSFNSLKIYNSFKDPESGNYEFFNSYERITYTEEIINTTCELCYVSSPSRGETNPYGTNMYAIDFHLQ